MKNSKQLRIAFRRVAGIKVFAPGGKAGFPQAHLVYEVVYADGTTKMELGAMVHSYPSFDDINPPPRESKERKARRQATYRPDLQTLIEAAGPLLAAIERACRDADEKRGITEAH